jgi:protein dithiol:quinone oxidoreductase
VSLFSNPTRVFAITAVVSAGGVAAALVSQHVFDMQPCPWCILQRMIFMLIAAVAVLGLFWRSRVGQLVCAVGVDLLATLGIAAALWQHFVAASSSSCNLTLADRIISGSGLDGWFPDVFSPRASCAEAVASLVGVPYEFWSLALFALLGALAVLALLGRPRARWP